jgi:hypothetical protein
MQSPQSQVARVTMRIETELPVRPTEKCRQNGAHPIYRRTLSSSVAIEDLATLPGSSEMLGPDHAKLLIIKLDGGEGGIRTPGTIAGTSDFESGALNRALPPLRAAPSLSGLQGEVQLAAAD